MSKNADLPASEKKYLQYNCFEPGVLALPCPLIQTETTRGSSGSLAR